VPLRKSPVRTPALLAANRSKALKCTGPRTPEGKARASMNSLKHGRHAVRLRENLLNGDRKEGEQLYQWLLTEICRTFEPREREGRRQAELMARAAWSLVWRGLHKTKPERPLESEGRTSQHPSLLRIRIDDPFRRRGFLASAASSLDVRPLDENGRGYGGGYSAAGAGTALGEAGTPAAGTPFRLALLGLWEQQALEQEWKKRAASVDLASPPHPAMVHHSFASLRTGSLPRGRGALPLPVILTSQLFEQPSTNAKIRPRGNLNHA
jgi:hypothetical protein